MIWEEILVFKKSVAFILISSRITPSYIFCIADTLVSVFVVCECAIRLVVPQSLATSRLIPELNIVCE